MSPLDPLESLFDDSRGSDLPLPPELSRLYGCFRFPAFDRRPHVFGNVVATLDGVVSLGIPGKAGGREISGDDPHDRLVMGLLRAVADVVIVGAGTFRASARRRWTAQAAYPTLGGAFAELRANLGKTESPLNVVVTRSGDLDLDRPGTDAMLPPLLVVTTANGATRLRVRSVPPSTDLIALPDAIGPREVLAVVQDRQPAGSTLIEAGPHLMGEFIAERCLDELFLTIAPQFAGRDRDPARLGLVEGRHFAPDDPRWATLVSLKRAGSHLFTRYALGTMTCPRAGSTTGASTK